ncbi:hypothetical protein H2203_000885 [Taxawa tesnikishii (nom. ined.)]|nr:hypothetical protein H2203_000885 [Dothideales sp. JES 119]
MQFQHLLPLLFTLFLGASRAIIGGNEIPAGLYEFTVAIMQPQLGELRGESSFICNGVLFSPLSVLTLGECVGSSDDAESFTVRDGTLYTGYQTVGVRAITMHPNCSITDTQFSNDLAILHLTTEIVFVPPVTLVRLDNLPSGNVSIVGWGSTTTDPSVHDVSTTLQGVAQPILPNKICSYLQASCGFDLQSPQHFCTSNGLRAGPLRYGDGGSPVLDSNGTVLGLVSGNPGCTAPVVSMHVFITDFFDWISDVVVSGKLE